MRSLDNGSRLLSEIIDESECLDSKLSRRVVCGLLCVFFVGVYLGEYWCLAGDALLGLVVSPYASFL